MSVLAAALTAAVVCAASPRVATHADAAVFIPRLDKLDGLTAFSTRAGERTALMRPSSWTSDFHPLLSVDPTRKASLTAAGMDPSGDATVSWVRDGKLSCVALSDPALFQKRADERLAELGSLTRTTSAGGVLVTAALATTVRAGYALSGRMACSFGNSGPTSLAPEAQKRAQRPNAPADWQRALTLPGVVYGVGRGWMVGARSTPDVLTLAAKGGHWPAPALRTAGVSPYAALTSSGLLFARAQLDARGVPDLARWLADNVGNVCAACPPGALNALADKLAPSLTGNVLLRVDRAEVTRPLKTPAGRFFALRQASLAELSHPETAAGLLAALTQVPGARAEGEGYVLPVTGGEVQVGVHGTHLYVANDSQALRAALEGLASGAGRQSHAVELSLDPLLAAKGLRQVSLLDVMSSAELASLFAAGTELGPLLEVTARISGWMDGTGEAQRGELSWALPPQKGPP